MSRNHRLLAAPAADVFDVLLHPETYPLWLVGCQRIRGIDDEWPAVGSRFHHAVGAGPMVIKDWTRLVESEQDRLLVLDARARPAGRAVVTFTLSPEGDGTRLEIEEHLAAGPLTPWIKRPIDPLIHLRNHRSLRQLSDLLRGRQFSPSPSTH